MVAMNAVLVALTAGGLGARAETDRVAIRDPAPLDHLAWPLVGRTHEVLIRLAKNDADVSWGVEAMRSQIPPRGPIPVLVVRAEMGVPGGCAGSADPLTQESRFRCQPCAKPSWFVRHEIREEAGQ